MALMKPKQITLTSKVNGEVETRTYNIGRYDGYDGIRMIGLGAELLDAAARKKMMSTDGVFATKLQGVLREQGKFIELVTNDGKAILDSVAMLKASIPDPDIAFQLMREVHDYNTAFFSSANLYQNSTKWMQKGKELGMKILTELSGSLSVKKPRRSKS